jgi:hypothetical protein
MPYDVLLRSGGVAGPQAPCERAGVSVELRGSTKNGCRMEVEATPGIEPGYKDLQSSA